MSNLLNANNATLLSRIIPPKTSRQERLSNNRDPSRLLIEGLLWVAIASRIFINQLGILNLAGLSGAIIISAGAFCLLVMIINGERIPISVWFALGVSSIANLTDLVITGLFARDLTFWLCLLLLACYVFRNANAALRLSFFMAGCIFLSIAIGGNYYSVSKGFSRLGLEPGKVGTMFSNPNDLAQIACLTLAALLFLSIGHRLIVVGLALITSLGLSAIVLLTLSRQGLIMLLIIFTFYAIISINKKNLLVFAIIFSLIILANIDVQMTSKISEIYDGYIFRWTLDSDRVDYWKTSVNDINETIFSGRGTFSGYNSDGVLPHSAFLWIHIAYGGICSLLYASWIIWLSFKIFKLIFDKTISLEEKSAAASVFIVFFSAQFTSFFAAGNYGFIIGIALIERIINKTNPIFMKTPSNQSLPINLSYADIPAQKDRLLQKC